VKIYVLGCGLCCENMWKVEPGLYCVWSELILISTSEGCIRVQYWFKIRRTSLRRNFNVTIRRAAYEACLATWNLGTNSAFDLGPRKTTENLDRVGSSQDTGPSPDANWLQASYPALHTRTLTLFANWLLLCLKKCTCLSYRDLFLCAYFGWATNNFV
jgi:hypothetical protein